MKNSWGVNNKNNINNKQKRRICKIVDFTVPADHRIKLKECEKKNKYHDLARELEKLWNMKVMIVPIGVGAFDAVTNGLLKGLEVFKIGGRVETIQNDSIIENGHYTKKRPRNLKRLAVTQTPVKNHQLTLIRKNLNE